jgi:L-fucose isomerase-like protein
VLHGDMDYMMHGIDEYVKGHEALTRLQGKRVGVIGKPSGWLIASGVDYESIKQSWGVELVDVPLQEVVTGYENIGNEEVKEKVEDFRSKASGMIEPTEEDLFKAMRLYESVKAVCTNHHLDAFTLNCFDLIPTTKTTGCLALALLNQEGIPAGCEGDIQTILTMLAVKVSTDEPCFMANPSKILDNKRHEMILAHCTIAPSMTYKFYIRSHFESSIGVAIQGVLHHCDMTILKCGGKDMSRYFISKASLLECTDNRNMCRTQMRMILEEPVDYFLKRSIGNHHVIVKGDHKDSLEWMMKMLGAKNILATK